MVPSAMWQVQTKVEQIKIVIQSSLFLLLRSSYVIEVKWIWI